MLRVIAATIPHDQQRYDTCGDWDESFDTRHITVSEMNNPDYEFAILIHEIIEQHLCMKRGIKEEDVTKFDIEYELARKNNREAPCGCKTTKDSEPGMDKHSPYFKEHLFATKLERQIANELDVDWKKYDDAVNSL